MFTKVFAAGVLATSFCIAIVFGLWSGDSALAQAQKALKEVQTASYTVTFFADEQPARVWRVKLLRDDFSRVEQENGVYLVFDVKGRRIMEVNPKLSTVRITENIPVPQSYNPLATLESLSASAANENSALPTREIDGKQAAGFVFNDGAVQFKVWIDPETSLPMEMERIVGTTEAEKSVVKERWSKFQFDVPLDDSLFELQPPNGFAVDTHKNPSGDASPQKRTNERESVESYGF